MNEKLSRAYAFTYDLVFQSIPEPFFVGPRRRAIIGSLSGLVLEIGAGTGLSLRYYPPDARVVATDIHTHSLERTADKARAARARAWAVAARAESLPFPSCMFDGMVCNLALCSIADPVRALAEARRVLKPGTPACFLEHVRAENSWQARFQDMLAPAWARVAGGCRLNQDTEAIIREAGLRVERVVRKRGLIVPMKLVWARTPL